MHTSISFLCSIVSDSFYYQYDAHGALAHAAPHLATYSLLPIVTCSSDVCDGATFWAIPRGSVRTAQNVGEAIDKGARVIVIAEQDRAYLEALSPHKRANVEIVIVPDARAALLSAAKAWRAQCMLPIVGITGTVGKTTTKQMLAGIFQADNLPVFTSHAEQNTVEGVACNILHLTDKHMAGVFEVGVSRAGEMAEMVALLQPTMGVITSVSPAYLDGLGDVEAIAHEQQQLFSLFSPSQIGVVCGDYPLLAKSLYNHPVVRFGLKTNNMVTAKKVSVTKRADGALGTKCVLKIYDDMQEIVLPSHHAGIVYAALAASAVAHFLHTPFETIVSGLQAFVPVHGRFEVRQLRDGRGAVVDDCHNTSPESMKAALHAVHAMDRYPCKIAVLGDIHELGKRGAFWHRHVGRELIKTRSISQLVLVGQLARSIGRVAPATMEVAHAESWQEAHEKLTRMLEPKDNLVLVNGAAGDGLSNIVSELAA